MRIKMSDPIYAEDLARFLARSGCIVERVGPDSLEASLLGSYHHDRLRLEVDLLLRAWLTTRPGARARLTD